MGFLREDLFRLSTNSEFSIINISISRAILSYLVAAYSKDDTLYPRDIRVRALIDQRLQFDLGTLYARLLQYFVNQNLDFTISRMFRLLN